MKKILLPTDFSENARKACEYAIQIFGDEPVQYILLNTYALPASTTEMLISLEDALRENSEEGLQHEKNFMASLHPSKTGHIETRSVNGYLENVLRNVVQHENIHLIVMGTTGASGFKKFFFGSNAAAALRYVDCPVLTVPGSAAIARPENIALALDEEKMPEPQVIAPLTEMVQRLNIALQPVHVDTSPATVVAYDTGNFNAKAKEPEYAITPVHAEDIMEGLQAFIKDNNIQLLAMIHRKRSFLDGLFHTSHTREMAMLSDIPLLVLRDKAH